MDTAMTHDSGGQWKSRRPTARYGTSFKVPSAPASGKSRARQHNKTTAGIAKQEPFSAKFVQKPSSSGGGGESRKKNDAESVMKVRFALSPVELPTFYPVREKPKSTKCLYATLVCPAPSKFKAKFIDKELTESVTSEETENKIKTESESEFVPIDIALQRAEHHASKQISQYSLDESQGSFPDDSTGSGSMDSALDQLLQTYPQVVEAAFRSLASKQVGARSDKKKAKACAGKMSLVKPSRSVKREADGSHFKVRVKLLRKVCKVYSRQAKPKKNRLMSTIRIPTPANRDRLAKYAIRPILSQDKAFEQALTPLKLAKSMPSLGQKRNSSSDESVISELTPHKLRRVASLSTDVSRNDDSSGATSTTSSTMPKNWESVSPSSTSCSVPSASAGLLSDCELMDVKRCSSPSRLLWM